MPKLKFPQLGKRLMFAPCLVASLLSSAQAQVRYDLYRGSGYIPSPVISPYFVNADPNFNAVYPTIMNNLIALSKTAGSIAASSTSSQADYVTTSYTLCDLGAYSNGTGPAAATASCNGRYQGYIGYTAILLPNAGTYNFRVTGNDAMQMNIVRPLSVAQATSTNLEYKGLTYTLTNGPLRNGGGSAFLTATVTQPTYIMFQMYWVNWGNDADFHLQWTTPNSTTYVTVPAVYTCDPLAPAAACFPDISIAKTGLSFLKPSVAASTNPPVTASANYADYALTVAVKPSRTGNAVTFGTTTLTDTLPSTLTWVEGVSTYAAPAGWTCTVSGQTITCTTTNALTAGNTYPVALNNVLVATDTAAGSSITNTATVTNPNESTGDQANNTSSLTSLTVLTKLTKTVSNLTTGDLSGAAAQPGDVLQYCISAQNVGGADLSNYVISDPIAEQLSEISNLTMTVNGSAVGGSRFDGRSVTSPALTIPAGQSGVLCFDATVR